MHLCSRRLSFPQYISIRRILYFPSNRLRSKEMSATGHMDERKLSSPRKGERVAIVHALRTPFAKQNTILKHLSSLELGTHVIDGVIDKSGIDPGLVERLVFGQVVPIIGTTNIARELVFDSQLSYECDAFSVSRACITGYQSAVSIVEAIKCGDIQCGIAGGVDSLSHIPLVLSDSLSSSIIQFSRAKGMKKRLSALASINSKELMPQPPALNERVTGLSMGESAEKMAHENQITRAAQDEFAHRSHRLASDAWENGSYSEEVLPIQHPNGQWIKRDNLVRRESSLEDYQTLRPLFGERKTLTAGNSSPLTDGACALLMMKESLALSLGLVPLGFIVDYAFCGIDPHQQMLQGSAYAIPKVLSKAGFALEEMALIDIHEAFAAQVLSVTAALESNDFAKSALGRDQRVGSLDWDKINVMGGSIALGHPFAATGGRQISQTLRELNRRGGGVGVVTACAAGGLGAAIILEVDKK